jgi:hypothetical protein
MWIYLILLNWRSKSILLGTPTVHFIIITMSFAHSFLCTCGVIVLEQILVLQLSHFIIKSTRVYRNKVTLGHTVLAKPSSNPRSPIFWFTDLFDIPHSGHSSYRLLTAHCGDPHWELLLAAGYCFGHDHASSHRLPMMTGATVQRPGSIWDNSEGPPQLWAPCRICQGLRCCDIQS